MNSTQLENLLATDPAAFLKFAEGYYGNDPVITKDNFDDLAAQIIDDASWDEYWDAR